MTFSVNWEPGIRYQDGSVEQTSVRNFMIFEFFESVDVSFGRSNSF